MTSIGALEIVESRAALRDALADERTSTGPEVIDLRGSVRNYQPDELHLTPAMQTARFEVPSGFYISAFKPLMDRLLGVVLLVLLGPLILLLAGLVRITMGPGVLFRQARIGYLGRRFTILKFRTMGHCRRTHEVPVDVDRRRTHKHPNDPRLTRLGSFLRKWSLDELPQLINIAKGEMSFVGPRPELDGIVEGYDVWQHRRHVVRPGLTGLWQVSARADGQLMCECTDVDIDYVESISLATDVKILVRTPLAALGSNRGI